MESMLNGGMKADFEWVRMTVEATCLVGWTLWLGLAGWLVSNESRNRNTIE